MRSIPCALTVAGSDSGGGAGIQADLKTFAALKVHGMSAITATTVQDTRRVHEVFPLPPAHVARQIDAAVRDPGVDSVKTGMIPTPETVEAVSDRIRSHRLERVVVDPVIQSGYGHALTSGDAVSRMKSLLFPLTLVLTPNLHESELLTGGEIRSEEDAVEAARLLLDMGPRAVVIKGGHSRDPECSNDLLFTGTGRIRLKGPRLASRDTHGSGCTFASAIAAHLARGSGLEDSVRRAKEYVTKAIRHSLRLGEGSGPLGHFHALWDTDQDGRK